MHRDQCTTTSKNTLNTYLHALFKKISQNAGQYLSSYKKNFNNFFVFFLL